MNAYSILYTVYGINRDIFFLASKLILVCVFFSLSFLFVMQDLAVALKEIAKLKAALAEKVSPGTMSRGRKPAPLCGLND